MAYSMMFSPSSEPAHVLTLAAKLAFHLLQRGSVHRSVINQETVVDLPHNHLG